MTRPSERAKRLIEELHEPIQNEVRWDLAQTALDEAFTAGFNAGRLSASAGTTDDEQPTGEQLK